jgi:hypothetical protein
MAKAGMNPKTLQYLMGHSDISVTLNTYTHWGLEDAEDELKKMKELEEAKKALGIKKKRNLFLRKCSRWYNNIILNLTGS